MSTFPMENNSGEIIPIYSPVNQPIGQGGSGFKTLTNARLVFEDGVIKTPNPLIVYCLASGPAGKTSIFMRRVSGTAEGIVNIYGAFKPDASAAERVLLVDGAAWSDDLTEIVTEASNPFFLMIIEYSFAGNDNTNIELNLSFF